MPPTKWRRLFADLWIRSEGVHESGAFLLGINERGRRCVSEWVLYDDYDPASLATGIVTLSGANLGRLWDYCAKQQLEVIADIHTHPRGAGQSRSDRENPIVAMVGHLSLIVPYFARPPVELNAVCAYEYLGDKKWRKCSTETLTS